MREAYRTESLQLATPVVVFTGSQSVYDGPAQSGVERLYRMVEWVTYPGLTGFRDIEAAMQTRAEDIAAARAPEAVWLVEHPPLYTAGTSARATDLTDPDRFPVHQTRRGGQYTYHGPGQRVAYVMLNVAERGRDVRVFVHQLESWIIDTLARFNLTGEIRDGRVGVWVRRPDRPRHVDGSIAEDKIAAIGIRLRKWVSFHGVSLNVEPDLTHFSGIVPCGIRDHGVTSLVDMGLPVTMTDVDLALRQSFETTFNVHTRVQKPPASQPRPAGGATI